MFGKLSETFTLVSRPHRGQLPKLSCTIRRFHQAGEQLGGLALIDRLRGSLGTLLQSRDVLRHQQRRGGVGEDDVPRRSGFSGQDFFNPRSTLFGGLCTCRSSTRQAERPMISGVQVSEVTVLFSTRNTLVSPHRLTSSS